MRRGGFLFPILLIAIGLAFLLSNLGYGGPLEIDALLQLWPLLLVLIGVDLLFARRAPLLALGLEIAIVALGLALVAARPAIPGLAAGEERVAVERRGESELVLRFSGGAGRYRIAGGSTDALVDARSDAPGLRLERVERSGGRATVELEQTNVFTVFGTSGRTSTRVDITVPRDVRISLDVSVGAGTIDVDLEGVTATDVAVSSGAGTLTLVLPQPSGEAGVRISTGAGTVTVEVPRGIEARVSAGGGVVTLRSSNDRLTVRGGSAETPGYAGARDRVSVSVDSGAGTVRIR